MGPSVLMILGFLLSQALSSDMQDDHEHDMTIKRDVTGILGEDVYLPCLYPGNDTDTLYMSSWSRLGSKKKLAGYYGQKSITSEGFSAPSSPSNLTVKMRVLSLDAEGEYTCEFVEQEDQVMKQVFLTVLVRPDVAVEVEEETQSGTHYQSVTCSATNAKPEPQISWEIGGRTPSDVIFSVQKESVLHANGTLDLTQVLRFPTHLNDESTVVCVVQHPALPEPRRAAALVQTFVAPDITMETGLVVESGDGGERMLRVVNCTALGGRPQPEIEWRLPGEENTLSPQEWSDDGVIISSVSLPAGGHERENVTCVVSHPKLTRNAIETLTLPSYYLSSVQLVMNSSTESGTALESLLLEEGEPGKALALKVWGDVPSYQTECTKDGSLLPHGVELLGGGLSFRGPVALCYDGLYECRVSFYKHTASVQLDVSVKSRIQAPILVAPYIRMKTWRELDSVIIECSALDAVPSPNVSWSLPPDLTGEMARNVSSLDGSDSATATLTLSACLPVERTVLCLVEHLLFEDPESREITLPACARPNIKVQSGVVWEQGSAYVEVECRVESVRPRANISWCVEDSPGCVEGSHYEGSNVELLGKEDRAEGVEGLVVTSVLQLPLAEFLGKSVVCMVRHQSLLDPERRVVQVQPTEPAVIRAFLVTEYDFPHLRAVCAYSGQSGSANITWLLPDNSTAERVVSSSVHEGSNFRANASYEFPLVLHEGRDLACIIHQEHGPVERRVVPVPLYYISSVSVMNKTTRVYGEEVVVHRVALRQHLSHQKILLRVNGNVPHSQIVCSRSDSSAALSVRDTSALSSALVFPMALSQREAGQYVCRASFHHHSATVYILVEVMSEEAEHMTFIIICFSSALAIVLILIVTLCVFCKRHGHPAEKENRKKLESISTLTSLMHDPRSPELKKAALPGVRGHQYAELVSIILVEKTTV